MDHVNKSLVAAVLAVRQGVIPADRAADILSGAADESEALRRVEGEFGASVAISPSLLDVVVEKLEGDGDLSGLGFDETTMRTLSEVRRMRPDDPGVRNTLLSISPTRMLHDVDLDDMPLIDAAEASETSQPTQRPKDGPGKKRSSSEVLRAVARAERYTIEREHARGGMGRILIARDNVIGRDVALKELLPQRKGGGSIPADSEGSRGLTERFLREAKVTGQLEHPNIVSVYEIGKNDDNSLYYTMKFVRGQTLAARLQEIARDSSLDKKEKLAARLKLLDNFADVCNALAYAHSKGVVHRDLKPENVMLGEYGETIVLDWGLARVKGQEDTVAEKLIQTTRYMSQSLVRGDTDKLTLDGSIVGTPAYMSPEQARGELDEIDEKSDVYALGAVLYQILCGRAPFDGPMAGLIIQQVLHSKPLRLSAVAPEVSPELEALVEKAMAKEKEQRLGSAREFASEVKAFRDGRTLSSYSYTARELAWRWVGRHKRSVIVGALVFYALIAGAVYHYAQLRQEKQLVDAEKNAVDAARRDAEFSFQEARLAEADAKRARLQAEAESIAARKEAQAKEDALRAWDETIADAYAMRVRLANEQNDYNAALAFAAAAMHSAGQPEARGTLACTPGVAPLLWNMRPMNPARGEVFQFFGVTYSPDGRLIATGMLDSRVLLWSTESGELRQEIRMGDVAVHDVAFSPDGRYMAAGTVHGMIRVLEHDAASDRYEHKGLDFQHDRGERVNALQFSPDGRVLYSSGVRIRAYDMVARKLIGEFDDARNHEPMYMTLSPDGRTLLTTSLRLEDLLVRVWDVPTRKFRNALLDQTSMNELFCVWSPDGAMLASSTLQGQIILRQADGFKRVGVLTSHTSSVMGLAFSPDGESLLSSAADGTVRLWDVASQTERLSLSGFTDWIESVAFAPDGLSFCARGRDGSVLVWAMPDEKSFVLRGHGSDVMDVRYSKDGKRILSAGWDGGVILWDAEKGSPIRTFTAPLTQFFCAEFLDDKRIAAGSSNGVFVWDAADGKLLANIAQSEYIPDIFVPPGGDTFIFSQYRQCVRCRLDTLEKLGETSRHSLLAIAIAQSPDGSLVATSSYDGAIFISNAATREKLFELQAGTGPVYSLTFSKDGKQLVAACDDRVARVWDLASRSVIHELRGHDGIVFCARFDGSGKRLFTSSQDRSVRVWNTGDWTTHAVLKGHHETVTRICVSPDGDTLLTGSQDDTLLRWDLPMLAVSRAEFDEIAFATTGLSVAPKSFDVRLDPAWPKGVESHRELLSARQRRADQVRRYKFDFEAQFEGYRYRDRESGRQYFAPRRRLPSGQLEGNAQGSINLAAWWSERNPQWTEGYAQAPIVTEIQDEGQARELGLAVGDVIWSVNGERVTDREGLRVKLEELGEIPVADFPVVIRRCKRDAQDRMQAKRAENGDYVLNAAGESEWDMEEFEVRLMPGKLGMRIGDTGMMAKPFR